MKAEEGTGARRVSQSGRGRRVFIKGGAGFIGSHLCDLFLSQGDGIIGAANLLTVSPGDVAHVRRRRTERDLRGRMRRFWKGPFPP